MKVNRLKVLDKSNGKCWYCGEELGDRWHVDHFLPLKRNPGKTVQNPENDTFENLVPSCVSCNVMKSSMDIEAFRYLIRNFVKRLNRDITIYKHAKRYGLVKETNHDVVFWFEEQEM